MSLETEKAPNGTELSEDFTNLILQKKTAFCKIARNPDGSFRRVDGQKQVTFLEKWANAKVKTCAEIDSHFASKDAALALLTGKETGITVVDFDSKENALFGELCLEAPTLIVETEKGFHAYYKYSDDPMFQTRAGVFFEGVDVRNDGGVIFCPPTPNYRIVRGKKIESLSQGALELLRENFTPSGAGNSLRETTARNDTVFRRACGWIEHYSEDETWSKMVKANKDFLKGELDEKELLTIFEQVKKYRSEKPQQVGAEEDDSQMGSLGLLLSHDGKKYIPCVENIFRILEKSSEFSGRFRYNAWTLENEILIDSWRAMEDSDYVPIQRKIQETFHPFRTIGKDIVRDAVDDACRAHTYDPAVELVRGTKWDGVARLHNWMSTVYGCPDDAYHQSVGENFIKGIVSRIIRPGCKFDSVLVLEGKQGCGKTTSLMKIAGDWHTETTMQADGKDFFLQFQGSMIIELGEGRTQSRTEADQLKAVISKTSDRFRPPYGRNMKVFPRRFVFAMTTNSDEYLKDETGNRRFFPVVVSREHVDLQWIEENRKQLFAEALYRVEVLSETIYEYQGDVEKLREERMIHSPYEEMIAKWIEYPTTFSGSPLDTSEGITIGDVWEFALSGRKDQLDKRKEMSVASALRSLGFRKERRQINGGRIVAWFPS